MAVVGLGERAVQGEIHLFKRRRDHLVRQIRDNGCAGGMGAGGTDHIRSQHIKNTDKGHRGFSLLSGGFADKLAVDGLHDHADRVVAGDVAGGAERVLRDVQRNHNSADRAARVTGLGAEDHVQEGQGGHNGAARSTGRCHHGNAEGHDERDNGADGDRQLVHQADCGSAGCDGNHRACHVDIRAQRNRKVADFRGNAVCLSALQVDRNGSRRGLGAQRGCVARDLVADERERIFVADKARDNELDADADQVHDDNNDEYLPQNTEDGKGLAGLGHIGERAADVKRQQWDDDLVQYAVNDAGEVGHTVVQRVADGLAAQAGHAQAEHKRRNNSGQRVHQRRNFQAEVWLQRVACGCGDLVERIRTHEVREQGVGYKERSRACDQGRAVGDGNRDEQQLARAALEVSNAHGNIREDHQRDDERQELTEERRERYHKAAEAFRQELAEQDADNDGDDELGQ